MISQGALVTMAVGLVLLGIAALARWWLWAEANEDKAYEAEMARERAKAEAEMEAQREQISKKRRLYDWQRSRGV